MAQPTEMFVDVAIIGSGFSGSLTALALRSLGQSVALIERGSHPRFAIGESSTPLANLLLEQLADRYGLPRIRAFSKWGTWQRTYPEITVGLKRGFSFFFHERGERFEHDASHGRSMLVAASPFDEIGDTHWYRQEFDHALVREAQQSGAHYLERVDVEDVLDGDSRITLKCLQNGRELRITAGFVVDASGPRGSLHQRLQLRERPLRWLPRTQGLYTHFRNAGRWDEGYPDPQTPFPPDDAALHHVFPGGWIWVLRFNNGITSAGAALTGPVSAELSAHQPAQAWERLLGLFPSLRTQFADAHPVRPFVRAPCLAFRSHEIVGDKWALLPSAAGIIDPLLSTGFPLTLLGIGRLLEILESTTPGRGRTTALERYARLTTDELDVTEMLVGALYANMNEPLMFKRLCLLYFAAASFSEAARRLGKTELAPGFLLQSHPFFGEELRGCAQTALGAPRGRAAAQLLERVDRAIDPFDIAGFQDRSRQDWYPVLAHDLYAGADKLQAGTSEIQRMLESCGFAGGASR
jgi:FADH2 O2-dependent halogenase